MFEKIRIRKRPAPVLEIHFPNLGRMGGRLCARRLGATTQENRQSDYLREDDGDGGSGDAPFQNGANGSGYFHGCGP